MGSKNRRNTGNYVIVDGFELTGSGNAHGLISGPWSSSGPRDVGNHFTATNNYVHDMAVNFCGQGGAITVFSPTGHSIITNNIIKNIAVAKIGSCATMQGIYISDTDSYVANNIVSGVAAVGIHQWHGATRSTIVNNTVFNCLWGILLGSGDSGMLPNGSQNNYVANNISVNNSTYGIREYGPTSLNTYRNNLLYNNPNNLMNASGDIVSGTITTNPMFINFQLDGTGNYHLQSSSPAIDKGTAVSAPLTDLDGISRPQGAAVDIGAYEFKSSASLAANASFSAAAISFENTNIFSKSSVKVLNVTNNGNASLVLKSLNISGDFMTAGSGSCIVGNSYAPGSNCTIDLMFSPTTAGTRTGVLGVSSNSSPAALTNISLSGIAVDIPKAPIASFSTKALNFGSIKVGSKSSVRFVTITNTGNAPLINPQAFIMTGTSFAFGGLGTCSVNVSYAPGQSCTASVVFKPKTRGILSGTLSILTNSSTIPVKIIFSGTGI